MKPLTVEDWKRAFHRLCIIDEWRGLERPRSCGADGVDWVPEYELFDPEAAARALLDNERVLNANPERSEDDWLLSRVLAA